MENRSSILLLPAIYFVVLAIAGCSPVPHGEISTVKVIRDDGITNRLSDEELARIKEFRQSDNAIATPSTSALENLNYTREYTVEEYLKLFPEAGDLSSLQYKVGPNDELNITVYDEPDLSSRVSRVSANGELTFPLVGRLKVGGLTTGRIEDLIANKLAEGQFVLDAQVSVMLTEFGSKTYKVLGAVGQAGIHPLNRGEQLLDGLIKAGGTDFELAGNEAMIIRTQGPGTSSGKKVVITFELNRLLRGNDRISNIPLMPDDTIFIPRAAQFYIIGESNGTGAFKFSKKDMTVAEAIAAAGGFTKIAARKRVRILRVDKDGEKIITVNVDAVTKGGRRSEDIIIQPGDIIIVPESYF